MCTIKYETLLHFAAKRMIFNGNVIISMVVGKLNYCRGGFYSENEIVLSCLFVDWRLERDLLFIVA